MVRIGDLVTLYKINEKETELLKKLIQETDEDYNELIKLLREVNYIHQRCTELMAYISALRKELARVKEHPEVRIPEIRALIKTFNEKIDLVRKYTPDLVNKTKMVYDIDKLMQKVVSKATAFAKEELVELARIYGEKL